MRIATAQWQIGEPRDFAEFASRVQQELAAVAAQGVALALLPEYLSLELAATLPPELRGQFVPALDALQAYRDAWFALFGEMARRHGLHVLAGTFLCRQANGAYRNRALLFLPDGRWLTQDKLVLTGFERASGVIEPGDCLQVFDTTLGRLAVNVCYDSEFPLFARRQYEAGAQLLLVPSCTDTQAGATRVRVACLARALENQIYVVQAVTAGDVPWSAALDTNTGVAAVYAPSDRGLPDDGVIARADAGATWLVTELDLAALKAVRQHGQVANARDWDAQSRPALMAAVVARAASSTD